MVRFLEQSVVKVLNCPQQFPILAACSIAHLYYFKCCVSALQYLRGALSPAMEDEWVQYHLTNQNVFEGSSIALSDLLLINAVPLWDSV